MLTLIDKSNYLKGLLLLAKMDSQLFEREKDFIRNIAQRLGFSQEFYEEVLKTLLANKNIKDDPILFSSKQAAELFIADGAALTIADGKMTESEIEWLKKNALFNNIEESHFYEIVHSASGLKRYGT